MSVAKWVANTTNSIYLRIRHPKAWDAETSREKGFDSLRGHKYVLLQSFKRSGEAVPTPIWFGVDDGKLYFHSYADAIKLKRIRNNPRVLVGPCDVRGKPKGPLVEGRARILSAEEEPHAEKAIQSNYGLGRRIYEAGVAMRVPGIYVEVEPK
jgi:PPOX class probable F420-dependent enzyme